MYTKTWGILSLFFLAILFVSCKTEVKDDKLEFVKITILNEVYIPTSMDNYVYWAPLNKVDHDHLNSLKHKFKTVNIVNSSSDTLLLYISDREIIDVRQNSFINEIEYGYFDDGWLPGTLDTLLPNNEITCGIFWEFWKLDSTQHIMNPDSSILYFDFWRNQHTPYKKFTIDIQVTDETFKSDTKIFSKFLLKK